jgi:hypothetical protein
VTAPIRIGFLAAASSAAATSAIGAQSGTSGSPQEAMDYFVRTLNAKGGLAGRRITVISSFIDPTRTNYDNEAAAACAKFTQDNRVDVVFSIETFYYSESFSACLAKAGVPELVSLAGGTDAKTLAKYPFLFSPTAPTVERRFTALLRGLTDNGYLSKANKVGVVVEECPYNQAVYASTIEPGLRSRGITAVRRDVGCVHGFGDAAAFIASVQSQVLPLAAAGADRVIFVSGFEQIAAQFFEQQAQSQGYRPKYALTSDSGAGTNTMSFSPEAMARVQGVGWSPVYDVTALLPGGAATQRCRQLWKGYPSSAERINRANNESTCDEFFLLEAALQRTGGRSDADTLAGGLLTLGTSYDSPLQLGGATRYGPGRKDGPALFATFGFKAGCSCFAYTSAPRPLA